MTKQIFTSVRSMAQAEDIANVVEAQELCSQLIMSDTQPGDCRPNNRQPTKTSHTGQLSRQRPVVAHGNRMFDREQTSDPSTFAAIPSLQNAATPVSSTDRPAPKWDWNEVVNSAVMQQRKPARVAKNSHPVQLWVAAGLMVLIGACWLQVFCWGSPRTDALDRQPIHGEIEGAAGRSGRLTFIPLQGTNGPAAFAVIRDGRYQFDRASGPVPGHYEAKILLEHSGLTVRDTKQPTGAADPFINPLPQGFERERIVAVVVSAGATQMAIPLPDSPPQGRLVAQR